MDHADIVMLCSRRLFDTGSLALPCAMPSTDMHSSVIRVTIHAWQKGSQPGTDSSLDAHAAEALTAQAWQMVGW